MSHKKPAAAKEKTRSKTQKKRAATEVGGAKKKKAGPQAYKYGGESVAMMSMTFMGVQKLWGEKLEVGKKNKPWRRRSYTVA